MNIDEAEYYIERWASMYNETTGNYEESVRERKKLADENERLKYELRKVKNIERSLQEALRECDIYILKRWEARVKNISTQEALTEKLIKMLARMKALQEVVDELRAQNERESTRVHELTIERDAGRRIIKEYMEALSELEDEKKKLQLPPEDDPWLCCYEHDEVKMRWARCILFLQGICKRKKGGKE